MSVLPSRFRRIPAPSRPPRPSAVLLAAVAVATLLAAPASAQVNIEKVRGGSGKEGLSSTLSADLSLRSGNVDLTSASGELRVDLTREGPRGFLLGRGGVDWKDGKRFSDSGLLHLRTAFPARPALELEAFTQIDYDKARKLDFRALAGAGPRLTLASDGPTNLILGTAYMREHEKYDLPPGSRHRHEENVSRWSSYLNLRVDADPVAGSCIVYAQPRFDRFEDVRILSEATLSVKVSRAVDLRNTVRFRWDSRPPDGIEDTDLRLETGIAVSLE